MEDVDMTLTFDSRESGQANLTRIEHPSWDEVESAIRRLDQQRHTEVTISKGGQAYLSASGGGGQFYVFMYTEDERSMCLASGASTDGNTSVVCGGQSIAIANKHIVGLDAAILAAHHYFTKGKTVDSLRWAEE
jgi:hypothetical protein